MVQREGGRYTYTRGKRRTSYGGLICQNVHGPLLDRYVSGEVLRALELSLEAAANIQKEREDLSELWRKRLERADYEAECQYHLVEPEFLGERFRRGKLQKAREGHFIGSKAPYGYCYVPKRDGVPGHLVVNETESELVRMLYGWLIEERMTVRQILKRLNAGPWLARCGGARWSASVVHRILSDPTYSGTAYANRYRYVPPEKPRARGPTSGENTCRKLRAKDEWIPIPVPPIVDEEIRRLAQAQLERNARLSFRNNKNYSYLLRCLLSCQSCGLAMFGVIYKATDTQPERRYYQCHGKDPIMSAHEHKCLQRPAKANELEETVWEHVKGLMRDPERLLSQFEQFAHSSSANDDKQDAEAKKFEAHLRRLSREQTRLVDAY